MKCEIECVMQLKKTKQNKTDMIKMTTGLVWMENALIFDFQTKTIPSKNLEKKIIKHFRIYRVTRTNCRRENKNRAFTH